MFRGATRTVVAASIVVAAAAVGIGFSAGASGPAHGRGPLPGAMSSLPDSTYVAGFTDWAHVRRLGSLTAARDRDLVTRSALIDVAPGLESTLGLGLRDLRWEVYAQGGFGEVVVARPDRDLPTAARLRRAGYRQNAESGIWSATAGPAAQESIYGRVAVLPRDDLLVMGVGPQAVAAIAAVVRGQQASFVGSRAVADAIAALAGVHTALIQVHGLGCEATEPGRDPEAARQVEAAQQRFGQTRPYSVLARGIRDTDTDVQRFRVAMTFPSTAVASEQARVRSALSQGPFIGRSGNFDDVLRLRSAGSDGSTAVLAYDHPADSEYLMTGQGPLLPASC
jgi:hypothetical protein